MGWVRALARSLLSDPSLADDVAQDAWVVASERPPRVHDGAGLKAWLASVTRTLARQSVRSANRRTAREQMAARPEASTPDSTVVERGAMHELVVRAVMELDEPFRSTVLLRYLDGLSAAQIAARRSESPALVRKRLERGLERLRARLDVEFGGDRRAWSLALAGLARRSLSGAGPIVVVVVVVVVAAVLGGFVHMASRSSPEVALAPELIVQESAQSTPSADAPRPLATLDLGGRTPIPAAVAASSEENRSAIVDELAARLDRIGDTFLTDRPDIDDLASLFEELGRSVMLTRDTTRSDPLTFSGTGILANLQVSGSDARLQLRSPTGRRLDPPFLSRDVNLGLSIGARPWCWIAVQFHPDLNLSSHEFLAEDEERLVGWSMRYGDNESMVQAITMTRLEGGAWHIGPATKLPADVQPGTQPPTCAETWRRILAGIPR